MKKYNILERKIAKMLENFPYMKRSLKFIYQRLGYFIYSQKGFNHYVHPDVRLMTPAEWSNITEESEGLFFGYYDKSPWSSNMNKLLLHRIVSKERVDIVIFDKERHNFTTIGSSSVYNLQQGCMAQWVPNRDETIIYNLLINGDLCSRLISLKANKNEDFSMPVQSVNPNGREFISINYRRLDRLRPEYGYRCEVKNFTPDQDLHEDGLWRVDMENGKIELILSLHDLTQYRPRSEMKNAEHKVNHVIYSPNGRKIVFMHRWIGRKGKFSRLYVANYDGTNLNLLMDDRMVSHYHWKDNNHLIVWGRTVSKGDCYYLINISTGDMTILGEGTLDVFGDGHPSFSPNKKWLITDTYPDKARQRQLLLFNLENNRILLLGKFLAPFIYDGENRCDLHPRWSPDGNFINIDSSHNGSRMNYILDISRILDS